VLARLSAAFREFGAVAGGLYLTDRLLRGLSPSMRVFVYELMVQPIRDTSYSGMRAIKAFEHREIRAGDPELVAMPVPSEVIAARFRQGAICFGTFKQERFAGYIWFAFSSYEEDEVRCTYSLVPASESVFDFDLYIFPEFRLGVAFVALWQGAIAFLSNRGIRQSFSRLTRFNVASRRAHAHLGWMLVARAVVLRLWSLECMAATVYPYLSVSVARRVRLELRADVLHRTTRVGDGSRSD
jgi:hypothetical protein